jgi:hypothetical protein
MKQNWKPAFSTSFALRASKQAGPWCTPGVSKILLNTLAGVSSGNPTLLPDAEVMGRVLSEHFRLVFKGVLRPVIVLQNPNEKSLMPDFEIP